VDFGKDLDLTAFAQITKAEFDAIEPVQWPVRSDKSDTRFFAKGDFFTPDKRGKMLPISHRASGNVVSDDFPLVLNTGRVRDHWHTMTRSAKSAILSNHMAEPYLEIHPSDAKRLDIEQASLVRVSSPHGTVIVRGLITERVQIGQLFSPIHWTSMWSAKARIDTLVPSDHDPFSGQPELKRTSVNLAPFKVSRFGFALSRSRPAPTTAYWATAQTNAGWRLELGSVGAPLDFEQFARSELNIKDGDVVVITDAKKSLDRIAFVKDGIVEAAMFMGPEPVAISRQFVIDQFDEDADTAILAGIAGSDSPDAGPTICSCFNIGMNTLIDAIQTGKAASPKASSSSTPRNLTVLSILVC